MRRLETVIAALAKNKNILGGIFHILILGMKISQKMISGVYMKSTDIV